MAAGLVSVSLVAAFMVGASRFGAFAYAADGQTVGVDVTAITAVLDSPAGAGSDLEAGVPRDLSAGPEADNAHSALVRITGFNAGEDATISVAGAPAVHVAAGTSASTTVLVPVVGGEFTVTSDVDLAARVEVLATFSGATELPGATVALTEAVVRPGGDVAGGAGTSERFGLVGLGGVPSEDVRAVHISLTAVTNEATTLELDGQRLPLQPGTTVLSTVVTTSSEGDLTVSSDADVTLELAVRGYVIETAQYHDGLNGPGSYWPELVGEAHALDVTDEAPAHLALEVRADAEHVLAMVWAEPAEALTTVATGDQRGRASGALVDASAGAQPQLMLIPASDPNVGIRRGSTQLSVLPIGSIIGTQVVEAARLAALSVTSPAPGDMELEDRITFTFTGELDPGDTTPLRIEVTMNGQRAGLASIVPSSDGVGWTYQAAIRSGGVHNFGFELVGRDGSSATTTWSGDIAIPGAEDMLLQEDFVALGWPGTDQEILETGDDHVDFATKPGFIVGAVIASGVEEGAPVGFLRRVVAIDDLGDRWRVHTDVATMNDVFLRVDRHIVAPMVQRGQPPTVELIEASNTGDPDESLTSAFLPVDLVDMEPYEHEAELEAEMDDSNIDEPPTDWNFSNAIGMAPMAMPVPPRDTPDTPSGPSQPPPAKPSPHEGETEAVQMVSWMFEDEGESNGLEYRAELLTHFGGQFALTMHLTIGERWTEWWGPIPPLPYPVIERFEVAHKLTAAIDVEGEITFKGAFKKMWKADVMQVNFNPITFWIGPVPVVFTFSFRVQLQAQIEIGAQFHLAFKAGVHVKKKAGTRYTHDRGWEEINEDTTTYRDPVMGDKPIFTGKVALTAGPEFSLRILIYDSAGPTIGIGLKAGLDVATELVQNGVKAYIELYLQGNIFLRVTAKIPVVEIELTDATLVNLKYKFSIKKWEDNQVTPTTPPPTTPSPTTPPPTTPPPTTPPPTTPPPTTDPGTMSAMEFASLLWIEEMVPPTDPLVDDNWTSEPVRIAGAEWVQGPPSASSVSTQKMTVFDEEYTYPVLSTGDSGWMTQGTDGAFGKVTTGRGPNVYDATILRLDLEFRSDAISCLYAEYSMGTNDQRGEGRDMFLMEWGESSWTVDGQMNVDSNHSLTHWHNSDYMPEDWAVFSDLLWQYWYNDEPSSFEVKSRINTEAMLEGGPNSLYISLAELGDDTHDTAVMFKEIRFMPWASCNGETVTVGS